MPRPPKCRRICGLPDVRCFGPLTSGSRSAQDSGTSMPPPPLVEMTIDEYETIRLIDLLGYTQEDCARQMDVARTTVQAIYNSARQKLADVLVHGKQLLIQGGSYSLCSYSRECCGKSRGTCCCHQSSCSKKLKTEENQNETCSNL
jgi:predicted DNA-binding protein (UPF0251 family)